MAADCGVTGERRAAEAEADDSQGGRGDIQSIDERSEGEVDEHGKPFVIAVTVQPPLAISLLIAALLLLPSN